MNLRILKQSVKRHYLRELSISAFSHEAKKHDMSVFTLAVEEKIAHPGGIPLVVVQRQKCPCKLDTISIFRTPRNIYDGAF